MRLTNPWAQPEPLPLPAFEPSVLTREAVRAQLEAVELACAEALTGSVVSVETLRGLLERQERLKALLAQFPEPEARKGRVEWTLTAKHPLDKEHKHLILVRVPAEAGRVHHVTGIRAAWRQGRNAGLVTMRSGAGPVKAFFYIHTAGPEPFPQPIRGEVGCEVLVGMQPGHVREDEDAEPEDGGKGERGPSASLVVWGYTDDGEDE